MAFILPIILGLGGAAVAYLYYDEDEETDLTVQEIINGMTDQEIDEIINEGSTVTTGTYSPVTTGTSSPVTTGTSSPVTTETPYRPPWINEDGSFNPDGLP
jgi:hypothetical protein